MKRAAVWGAIGLMAACATLTPWRKPQLADNSAIEIAYLRGHNKHRFIVFEGKERARIGYFKDHELLKEIVIGKPQFDSLVEQSHNVMGSLERNPAAKTNAPCRTPFTLRVRQETQVKSVEGCRATDEGAIVGKLIKEVEFIMSAAQK